MAFDLIDLARQASEKVEGEIESGFMVILVLDSDGMIYPKLAYPQNIPAKMLVKFCQAALNTAAEIAGGTPEEPEDEDDDYFIVEAPTRIN